MALHTAFQTLRHRLHQQIIGQTALIDNLLLCLLAEGHLLVEGAPGLAKTRAAQALARACEGQFQRIQFTPDLLPADLTGTDIFHPQTGAFSFRQGPIFSHFVLADEINRAPAKVQSALLEAMAERQISVGTQTYPLPPVFMVIATQNPLEQEGTYALPEAQLDRFLLHTWVSYPGAEEELAILRLVRHETRSAQQNDQLSTAESQRAAPWLTQQDLLAAREAVQQVHLAPALETYIVDLVQATRQAGRYDAQLGHAIEWGASPRASLALDRVSRARAWLAGRDHVLPEDIRTSAPDVLRHRLILSYQAQASGTQADAIIQRLLDTVICA
ncbi:MoxR family ATPase [Marinospirillum sp. MEB164]|uniref:MoxR family ATPase n=1 Tax=Marinospirillum alkalitolerans TaxID=3123374 RepID=A0ABW8PXR5_9GAMM